MQGPPTQARPLRHHLGAHVSAVVHHRVLVWWVWLHVFVVHVGVGPLRRLLGKAKVTHPLL